MVQKSVLENGVRLVSESLPGAYSVTLGFWLEVGSRDEEPALGGVSHFIEHMAFKGTNRRGPLDIAREIDRLGGLANAFTSKENTCFHARALSEHMPGLGDLLLDLVLSPIYQPEELERERQVILQEICAVEDTPDDLVHVLFGQNFWPNHPLGRPVLGTSESVSSLNRQVILDYLHSAYRPEGMVVAAVGNLEHEQFVDMMSGPLTKLRSGGSANGRKPPRSSSGIHIKPRDLEQVHVAMGATAPSATHPARYATALLNLILGGNMSSRLFQEIREKRGLAYSIYSYYNTYSDSGMLGVYMGVAADRATEAMKVVRQEMAKLAAEGVSEDELSDARDNLKGSILLASENPESRMSRLARNELHFGRVISLDEIITQIDSITIEDIARMSGDILRGENLGATVLGPLDQEKSLREMGW